MKLMNLRPGTKFNILYEMILCHHVHKLSNRSLCLSIQKELERFFCGVYNHNLRMLTRCNIWWIHVRYDKFSYLVIYFNIFTLYNKFSKDVFQFSQFEIGFLEPPDVTMCIYLGYKSTCKYIYAKDG